MYLIEKWRQQLSQDEQSNWTLGHLIDILSKNDYNASGLRDKASTEYKSIESSKFTLATCCRLIV